MSITLNPELMALVFIVFIALLIIMNKILYKPMLAFMDAREERLAQALSNAATSNEEVAQINAQIASIMDEARKKSGEIIQAANDKAKSHHAKEIAKKMDALGKQMESFKAELAEQGKELAEHLKSEMPAFKSAIKTKLHNI